MANDHPITDPPLMSMSRAVGLQARAFRKDRGLTLEQLSGVASLSIGLISEIERGKANPSFNALVQLAHGLGVPVWRLLNVDDQNPDPVVRRAQRKKLDGHGISVGDGGDYALLTPDLNGALEVTWVETPPGYDTSGSPFQHRGEECGLIISGRKDVYLDGVRHELGPGDSITYSSEIPHWYVNPGDEDCVAVWVITPPTW